MAGKRTEMSKIKQILLLHKDGMSNRKIGERLGLYKETVNKYVNAAKSDSKSIEELVKMGEPELQHRFSAGNAAYSDKRFDALQEDLEYYVRELERRHVTMYLLWEEYRQKHPDGYGYTQFCYHLNQLPAGESRRLCKGHDSKHMTYDVLYEEYLKSTDNPYGYTQFKAIIQEYERNHDYKYHNVYEPGCEMQFDFAGDNLWIVDKDTGEAVKAIVLVCVLPYSMLSYVTALPSAKMEYLFQALSRAVRYFGGVAEVSKTDNMRQWIRKTDRYEPTLNEAARQWCLHNGTELDECRPARPRDKGPAESLVNQTYRYYYSRICRDTFFSYDELNGRLDELNDMFNDRPRKNRTYSRREQYEREERPYMLPLPPKPFLLKYTKEITINSTYHFQVDRNHFYSVPYQHIGRKAKVIYDAETVEVWIGLDRIAAHDRKRSDGYTTVEAHMPEKHMAYRRSKEVNAAYLQSKASQIGPHTRESIDCILKSALFVQQAYRSCQGVLRLAVRYEADRLEAACRRIEPKTASTYKRIEAILKNNLDDIPLTPSDTASYMPRNDNVRGASAYQ